MSQKAPKIPTKKKKIGKSGLCVILVTSFFAILGTIFMIIGYHDEFAHFLVTTGIALLVVAALPLGVWIFTLINKRIDS